MSNAPAKSLDDLLAGLDEDQRAVVTAIRGPVCVIAGAGTGKTVLLVNLALSLATQGRNVVSQFNEQVLKYLNSGKQKVPGSGMKMQPGAVVLLDDPENLSTLQQKLAEAKRNETRALVVALDPFQWTERRVYEKLKIGRAHV